MSFADIFDDKPQTQALEISPEANSLDLLRAVYRNPSLPLTTRMRAAIAALPFELPKLAVTAVLSREQDYAALLDQRLDRARQNGYFDASRERGSLLSTPHSRSTVEEFDVGLLSHTLAITIEAKHKEANG